MSANIDFGWCHRCTHIVPHMFRAAAMRQKVVHVYHTSSKRRKSNNNSCASSVEANLRSVRCAELLLHESHTHKTWTCKKICATTQYGIARTSPVQDCKRSYIDTFWNWAYLFVALSQNGNRCWIQNSQAQRETRVENLQKTRMSTTPLGFTFHGI